ncbi:MULTISPECIES: OstA-like protein [unclassified Pedobacter]|uniref:OstA-like protein n=1 Tax=unclassified Pedobacter TaxID=2628915 RepID=UPI001DF3CC5A|nr:MULTISPECIES: OstA-like protein [unclassified Pedobacter]CAH0295256.1 LPS-assembly protein LptD [Pedobacter sp. Bi36]CAH0306109.1 LPS-assembly protein LptD [Pedobacter sp. Bi126]
MQKLFVFLFLLISPVFLFGQRPASKIKIVSFTKITGDLKNKVNYLRNPVFQQDNATLTCDSAVFYSERNYFEAFKNVHINQLTTDIYSDQLEYDGNKKHAHLTGNVVMKDPTSTLTTNILDYNTLSKIGTYTSGGKIVNQEVTVTSKNGYYFSQRNVAYFKYDVVVVTPQSVIKSDTMSYNTQDKWTYFYGPTNIKGKDDNLYTENGQYNTMTEDAFFGKKNLYTQGTRSLKGDSLYYFGKKGIGKAVKNIIFSDTKDKMKMFGDLGYYYKLDQRTLVTRNAYLGIGTEDSIMVKNKKRPDSLWMGADTLETQMVLQKTLKLIPKISIKADNQVGEDDEDTGEKKGTTEPKEKPETQSTLKDDRNKRNTAKISRADRKKKNKGEAITEDPLNLKDKSIDSLKSKVDSLGKDLPKLNLDSLQKNNLLKNKADSIIKNLPKLKTDSLKKLADKANSIVKDVPKTKIDSLQKKITDKASPIVKDLSKTKIDSLQKKITKAGAKDSLTKALGNLKAGALKTDTAKFNPADTVQTRIIKAYHGVKIFKTNIQAKTDSLFYTSADSTLRCYSNPIIWSEGSQQVGDTIFVQFKNKKLNNLQAFRNAFLVNTPKDSLRFNQIKGRLMTGFFTNGKFKNLYVDGNAESIYYTQDDSTKVYKEMNQTLSSRIKFIFKDNENAIEEIVYIKGIEGALNPENTIAKDHVLKGFSWKPTERPKSKKDAIGSSGKPKPKAKAKTVAGKTVAGAKTTAPTNKPATAAPAVKTKITLGKDSLNVEKKLPQTKPADTANFGIKPILPKKDSVQVKKVVGKM